MDIIGGLRVPSIVVAHTVLKAPTPHQHSVLEGSRPRQIKWSSCLRSPGSDCVSSYGVDRRKVTTISHGATVPSDPPLKRPSRPTVLTWGLLGPGKGIERVIEVMGSLKDFPGRPRYLVAGPTHPNILAADGEAYRDARRERARRSGVADSVSFDARYWNASTLPPWSSPRRSSYCRTTPPIRSPPVPWSTPSRVAGRSWPPPFRTPSSSSVAEPGSSSTTTIPARWHQHCATF